MSLVGRLAGEVTECQRVVSRKWTASLLNSLQPSALFALLMKSRLTVDLLCCMNLCFNEISYPIAFLLLKFCQQIQFAK
jgi:hypothetical protein